MRSYPDVVNDQALHSTDQVYDIVSAADAQTIYLKPYQQVVRANITDAGHGNITVYLPNVREAQGKSYAFHIVSTAGTVTVTVDDNDKSEQWGGDYTLDAVTDTLMLMSDGTMWHEVTNTIA